MPYIFNADAGDLGGKVGFIFSFLSIARFVIVWFEIPEMKNRTYAELDEMFEKKLARGSLRDMCAVALRCLIARLREARKVFCVGGGDDLTKIYWIVNKCNIT